MKEVYKTFIFAKVRATAETYSVSSAKTYLMQCPEKHCFPIFCRLEFRKEVNMTNDEIYDFIGELAIALYSKKIQISLGALRAIMLDKGKDYVNNRGMASAVSAAYRRWKSKDPIIYYAIAYTYTDKEGNLAWDESKLEK